MSTLPFGYFQNLEEQFTTDDQDEVVIEKLGSEEKKVSEILLLITGIPAITVSAILTHFRVNSLYILFVLILLFTSVYATVYFKYEFVLRAVQEIKKYVGM